MNRPENAELLEKQQRKEIKQGLQMQEKMRALEFREKVRLAISMHQHASAAAHGRLLHSRVAYLTCVTASTTVLKCCHVCLQVLESDYDSQKNVAPFLQNRFLRRIIQVCSRLLGGLSRRQAAKKSCTPLSRLSCVPLQLNRLESDPNQPIDTACQADVHQRPCRRL